MRGSLCQGRPNALAMGDMNGQPGLAGIFNVSLNADRLGSLQISAKRHHFRKTKLSS